MGKGGVGRVWVGYEEVGRYEEVGVGYGEVWVGYEEVGRMRRWG